MVFLARPPPAPGAGRLSDIAFLSAPRSSRATMTRHAHRMMKRRGAAHLETVSRCARSGPCLSRRASGGRLDHAVRRAFAPTLPFGNASRAPVAAPADTWGPRRPQALAEDGGRSATDGAGAPKLTRTACAAAWLAQNRPELLPKRRQSLACCRSVYVIRSPPSYEHCSRRREA